MISQIPGGVSLNNNHLICHWNNRSTLENYPTSITAFWEPIFCNIHLSPPLLSQAKEMIGQVPKSDFLVNNVKILFISPKPLKHPWKLSYFKNSLLKAHVLKCSHGSSLQLSKEMIARFLRVVFLVNNTEILSLWHWNPKSTLEN